MGVANPCRSCGLALWVAGRDAGGKWIKVNLDGSAHVCGAQTMVGIGIGLGRYPVPYGVPAQPMLPPGTPYMPPQPPVPSQGPHPVVDQGRAFVERFMVGVALVALVLLATFPRAARNGGPAPGDHLAQLAASQRVGGAPSIGVSVASAGAPAQASRKDIFTMASTEDDVMAVMGPPREIVDNRWWYGSSYVDFRNGRVVNFYNSIHGELKVKMQGVPRNRPAYLAKGITKDEVLHLQGTPTRLAGNRWYYGSSYVDFQEDRVTDYFNGVLKELKVSARPTQ